MPLCFEALLVLARRIVVDAAVVVGQPLLQPREVALPGPAPRLVLDQRGEPAYFGLRMKVQGGGCSGFSYDLYFDQPQEGVDRTLESHGVKILVDMMSFQYLVGTEVDYVEGLQGAGFKFGNPNVKSTCGCGSSFSV